MEYMNILIYIDMYNCDTIFYYRDSLIKNKKTFDLHIQLLKNGLTRKIIQAYLEERRGYFVHQQEILSRLYDDMDHIKFKWIKPFIQKRPDHLDPDITRLLNDKNISKKLMQFLDYVIKVYKCKKGG